MSRLQEQQWRDVLGRIVREAWIAWAREQPGAAASWLVPYDELPEADREADRRIGEAVYTEAWCGAGFGLVRDLNEEHGARLDDVIRRYGVSPQYALDVARLIHEAFSAWHPYAVTPFDRLDPRTLGHNAALGLHLEARWSADLDKTLCGLRQPDAEEDAEFKGGWNAALERVSYLMARGAVAQGRRSRGSDA